MTNGKRRLKFAAGLTASLLCSVSTAAFGQSLNFITFGNPGSVVTTVTGIRDRNMTGDYTLGSGGDTGGQLYTLPSLVAAPYPTATSSGANLTGATTNTPYGPSFGSATGILRVTGSYKSPTYPSPTFGDVGYLYDGANAPGQQLTTLIANNGTAFNTIGHSNFGNQLVGNWDTGNKAVGNAFLYDIAAGTMTNINRPGPYTSTTAYGVYGDRIAGGSSLGPGLSRAYILNQTTGLYTDYDAPGTGTVVTHFEGITGGGRANTYNLVADSVDATGTHAWVVHIDQNGNATWTELSVPGASTTSANSIYGSTAIGVYTLNGVTYAFTTTVPGIYNPITNNASLTSAAAGAVALSGIEGDDIVNNGTVAMSGPASVGININTYGTVTNNGTVGVTGAGSSAVQLSGSFSSLLNYGTVTAAPGGLAVLADSTASGSIVVNYGTIDGQVLVNAGPLVRFENSGWMGIGAAGAGVTHQVSGTFAQTSAGILSLRVAPNGVSDQLLVNGVARLAGTAQAVFQPGTYSRSSYTLLTATGGLTGTFGALSTVNLPAFLSASLGYGTNTVTLSLQSAMASLPGLSNNQGSVARALDGAFNSGSGLNAVSGLYGLSAPEIGQALTVLSGSNASVGQAASLAAGGQFAGLLAARAASQRGGGAAAQTAQAQTAQAAAAAVPADACGPATCDTAAANWSAWGTAFGGAQWLNADGGVGSPAAQQSIGGGAVGIDVRVGPQTLVGLALGLSDSSYWVGATGANGRATGFHAGLYGQQDWAGFYVSAALAYSRFDGNATRPIAGIGTTETAKSSAIANQLGGRLEIGRAFELAPPDGGRLTATPFVALQPMQLWTPAYSESSVTATGAPGVFGLSYQAQSTTSLPLFLGAQFDTETVVQGRPLSAWVRAAWVHEFLPERSVTAGFEVLPGTSFTVDGARAAYNAARVDLGARYDIASRTSLFINGSAELSYRGQAIAGVGGLRFSW
ncbi:autotransporter outer membrane beta-barrel domain-containing protein [Reyranella sp.]|uniref:autotransporter outer membrane beta-barrel domain-containing protein n=1 Tax=Reyranella sp. TaxID=1929291 RepID=UPI003BAC7B61